MDECVVTMPWQDIITAPRDGTVIVGWGKVAWFSSADEDEREPARAVEIRWDGDVWEAPTPIHTSSIVSPPTGGRG